MLFGPDLVVACPRCGAAERVFTLRTANSLGEVAWTDGHVSRPFHWEPPPLCRCSGCRGFYWLEDAAALGELPDRRRRSRPWGDEDDGAPEQIVPVPEVWAAAPRVTGLDLDGLLEAVEANAADTPDRERSLRLLALRASSHRNRNPRRKKDRQKTPAERRNMAALLALCARRFEEMGDPEDLLVCAEVRRQSGDHGRALALLARVDVWPGELRPFAETIGRAATAASRRCPGRRARRRGWSSPTRPVMSHEV
jgi:hypothetical protein